MSDWRSKSLTSNTKFYKSIEDFPEGTVGFVYRLTNKNTNESYIGKKILMHKRTLKPLKGYKRKRVKYVESDWKTYTGSNEITKTWKPEDCYREVLEVCCNKTIMSYFETKYQFILNVLENDNYLNYNIGGKYYKDKIQDYIKKSKK